MTAVAEFLAGFAFFLVGLKMFSSNLNQLTSRRFRKLITQFTPNNFLAGVWGVILSILTAGNTYLTPFVAAGFQTVNALSLRRSIHMINWSRVGACFYIYLAGFNIQVFILFLIGAAGTSFALGKPKRLAPLMASVFALGLVLFGIQHIKHSTKVLVTFDWFAAIIEFANTYPEVAFFAGLVFIIFAQSLFGALVVVLGLLDTNIFGMEQALLFTYGVFLGEAILKLLYLPILKDAFKQAICMLPIFYVLAFIIGISDYVLEKYLGIPLLEAFAGSISASSKEFLAHINFGVHLIAAIIISVCAGPIERFLTTLSRNADNEDTIRPVDIPSGILDDPVMTMELVASEEARLVSFIPHYHENVRSGRSLLDDSMQLYLHEHLSTNFETIRSTYGDLLNRGTYHASISAQILQSIERQNLLMSLESNIFEFSQTIDSLRKMAAGDKELSDRFLSFVEAMDVILLSLIDVMEDPDPFQVEVIETLTTERDDLLKQIREKFSTRLSVDQQVLLIRVVNLFESSIWVIKKLAPLYVSSIPGEGAIEEAIA